MTSQSHTASVGVPRRPAPPRPAPSTHVPAAPATYVPAEYDSRLSPAAAAGAPGQIGLVYPKARTGRGVWAVLLLIVASVAGFVGWRAVHTGAAPEPGVAYTSTAGHFSARFPAQPVELTRTERDGATRLVVRMALVAGQGGVVQVEIIGPMHGNVRRLAERFAADAGSTGEIRLSSVTRFTFQGMRAEQGNFIAPSSGQLETMLMAVQSNRTAYLVLGLTGPTFDALKESFRPLP